MNQKINAVKQLKFGVYLLCLKSISQFLLCHLLNLLERDHVGPVLTGQFVDKIQRHENLNQGVATSFSPVMLSLPICCAFKLM